MKNSRLLCIVSSMNTGGAETFLMKLLRQMCKTSDARMDFIVATDEKGYYDDEILEKGCRIFHIPLHSKHPIRAFLEVRKIVKQGRYSSVLKLCNTPLGGYSDLLAAKLGGAKKLSARSCNANSSGSALKKRLNSLLRGAFNRLLTCKIAPSDLAGAYTFGKKQVEKGNVVFLHNAVDTGVYRFDEAERRRIREEFGLQDAFVVGNVGRLTPQKNHSFLLKVFAEVLKSKPNAKLLLVGDGEIKAKISGEISSMNLSDKVIFTGVRKDIPALLSAMDVFVMTSFYEGMPNTVIEAQATGLSCVISDSITKEANITGLVSYLPLSESPARWGEVVLSAPEGRPDTKEAFIRNGYDIESATEKFVELVF